MSGNRPAFIWSPAYEVDIGRHVFPTQKFRLLKELMVDRGIVEEREIERPDPATDHDLLSVLLPEYLADLRGHVHTRRTMRSELPITRSIIEGMVTTAGGTLLAARRALQRGGACHFGGGYHHAYAGHAEGFCYINDIAVAIAVLRREGLIHRAAVVDIDVHQGNGTASIFRDTPEVFTFSIHQEDLYPRPKERSTLDIGLPEFPGSSHYLSELQRGLEAAIHRHRPDLVVIAAGVDTFEHDQLGDLGLSFETMRQRDRLCIQACVERGIPFVTVLAGGYARQLSDTVALHGQTVEEAITALDTRT